MFPAFICRLGVKSNHFLTTFNRESTSFFYPSCGFDFSFSFCSNGSKPSFAKIVDGDRMFEQFHGFKKSNVIFTFGKNGIFFILMISLQFQK